MRATWLTDIHLNFLRPHALAQFYASVQAEGPDALLITGDIAEADSVARYLGELAAIAPVYFVLGNHDYYRGQIRLVREEVQRIARATWMPAHEAMPLGEHVTMIGVDGWGDARCGDLASRVQLSDWNLIEDFRKVKSDREGRIELLQRLGNNEARSLRDRLSRVPPSAELLVLTHVPPFPEACIYEDASSDPQYLPWFTCIATGEVLREYARAHRETRVTVLCGHSHGLGTFAAEPNLEVRTGGWPRGAVDYGNPLVQLTLVI